MFLSLEVNKFEYLQKNLTVNENIQKNKYKALLYLELKILNIKLKIDTIDEKFVWKHFFRLFSLIVIGSDFKGSIKFLILYLFRKQFKLQSYINNP